MLWLVVLGRLGEGRGSDEDVDEKDASQAGYQAKQRVIVQLILVFVPLETRGLDDHQSRSMARHLAHLGDDACEGVFVFVLEAVSYVSEI